MSKIPNHLIKEISTRARSKKQEVSLAKDFKGRTTINSGATFTQNDVTSEKFEIEAKTTDKESFILKLSDLKKMRRLCSIKKVPLFIVEMKGNSYVTLDYEDFKELVSL